MKRTFLVASACLAVAAIGLGASGAIGATGNVAASARQLPPGAPALRDPTVPSMPRDLGAGELLHLVVGGTYDTREQAEAAGESMSFGDLQGYYVVPVAQFGGLQARLPVPGRWALVSAFRTLDGAKDFAELARAAGAPALVTERLSSRGGEYAGLGQEPAPGGEGPLTHPIPASMP